MNTHHVPPNYIISGHGQSAPVTSESRIDKAYITSIRGILKFACLVKKKQRIDSMKSD